MSHSDAKWRNIVRALSTDLLSVQEKQCVAASLQPWQRITDKFAPLIGAGSVNLLLVRSIQMNIPLFPFLADIALFPVPAHPLFDLKHAYEGQARDQIVAANFGLMQQFLGLLASLIGDRLCGQLLGSTFPDHDADDAALEIN